mmetsp:Transcript_33177/g.33789  ORF Transcript_33177/g.33789 Transcript_33177/m.33789 type:complete len:107 (-) Transcript_33177:1517-1837(-)
MLDCTESGTAETGVVRDVLLMIIALVPSSAKIPPPPVELDAMTRMSFTASVIQYCTIGKYASSVLELSFLNSIPLSCRVVSAVVSSEIFALHGPSLPALVPMLSCS